MKKIEARFKFLFVLLATIHLLVIFDQSAASAATIQTGPSILAILTDKEGVAAGLAHRHIIASSKFSTKLQFKKSSDIIGHGLASMTSGDATISLEVKDLEVDAPDVAKGILGVLEESKHWDATKDKLEPGNAAKVRVNMLDSSQLDAETFNSIEGSGNFSNCEKIDDATKKCTLQLTLRVRGQRVDKQGILILKQEGLNIVAEFVISYKFSEFGIKYYTAMFGAIAVKDEFFLAARLVATEK